MSASPHTPAAPPSAARSGEIAAALLALWLGLTAVAAAHWWSIAAPYTANRLLLKAGVWVPGWWGIGPFAGKETVGLALWLGSWLLLHAALRNRRVRLKRWLYGFAVGFLALLIALWPPVYHAILGWLPAVP